MGPNPLLLGIAALLALVAAPLILGLTGLFYRQRAHSPPWNWRLVLTSTLLYALAFNLVFFLQELTLVLSKALVPGLHPVLYHNNHTWTGHNPLASLMQGTGALATFTLAVVCTLFGRRRLFLLWIAYSGFFQSLPQVIIGSINPQNDVGMAMNYLGFSATTKTIVAVAALAAIPTIGLALRRPFLRFGPMLQVATVPALAGVVLIIPFRVPREFIEVAIVPAVVSIIGVAWLQAGAWLVHEPATESRTPRIAWLFGALFVLLLIFQCVLRPGLPFNAGVPTLRATPQGSRDALAGSRSTRAARAGIPSRSR